MKSKLLCFLYIISLCSCSSNKYTLFLGEDYLCLETSFYKTLDQKYLDVNNEFASRGFLINKLYQRLETSSINLRTNNSLINLLTQTKLIIFSCGTKEIQKCIETNTSLIQAQEIYEYYYHHVVDILSSYTQNIIVLSFYNYSLSNDLNINQYVQGFNNIVYLNCLEFNLKYCDITKLSSFLIKDYYLSSNGINYLINQIDKYD